MTRNKFGGAGVISSTRERTREPSGSGRGVSLRVRSLTCRYGPVTAVDGVDLDIGAGERVALLGANGSGKSTLLRAVGGLQRWQAGSIEIDGAAVRDREALRSTVWVPQRQSTGRFPLRVSELLASSGEPSAAEEAARSLGLGSLLRRPISTLSGGQLQRTFIARAVGGIAAGRSLLLADEPTAALDFDGQAEMARLLGSLPVTMLVATHDRAVAAVCDRVVEMAAGRLREVRP